MVFGYEMCDGWCFEWVFGFFVGNQVEVVVLFFCYQEENVEYQCGCGFYLVLVEGLLCFNDVGYGMDLELFFYFVYNFGGVFLLLLQDDFGVDYYCELKECFGIVFDELWMLINMLIKCWCVDFEWQGQFEGYMDLFVGVFNLVIVDGFMCCYQIYIDSQGCLYDCDFNYVFDLCMEDCSDFFFWDMIVEEFVE